MITLQSESITLKEQIKQAIISGDVFLLNKLRRSKSELDDKVYFQNLKSKRERLQELAADSENAEQVRDDLQSELKASGAIISNIRANLEAAESEHAIITSRLFVLDGVIDSNRRSIAETERELQRMIESKIIEVTN